MLTKRSADFDLQQQECFVSWGMLHTDTQYSSCVHPYMHVYIYIHTHTHSHTHMYQARAHNRERRLRSTGTRMLDFQECFNLGILDTDRHTLFILRTPIHIYPHIHMYTCIRHVLITGSAYFNPAYVHIYIHKHTHIISGTCSYRERLLQSRACSHIYPHTYT